MSKPHIRLSSLLASARADTAEWIDADAYSHEAIAERLGVSKSQIYALLAGGVSKSATRKSDGDEWRPQRPEAPLVLTALANLGAFGDVNESAALEAWALDLLDANPYLYDVVMRMSFQWRQVDPDRPRPYGCKCDTLAHKLTGDGCDECNPDHMRE